MPEEAPSNGFRQEYDRHRNHISATLYANDLVIRILST